MRIGIDEVGRGSLAGAVYACVFCTNLGDREILSLFEKTKLRDSKQLTRQKREAIYRKLSLMRKEGRVSWSTGRRSAPFIDKYGINKAISKSIASALRSLHKKNGGGTANAEIFLDGGLFLGKEYKKQKTVIRGDETVAVIACASIIAKVTRDRYMKRLGKKHPAYGFGENAGYGTKLHITSLEKNGKTLEHRHSFLKNLVT